MNKKAPKILFIEDEPDPCWYFQRYFGRRGVRVTTTGSGREALSIMETSRFDLIFLDLSLEDMDGVDVLKELREKDKETRVIVLTGRRTHSEEEEKAWQEEIQSLGITAYLEKPKMPPELEPYIFEFLGMEPSESILEDTAVKEIPEEVSIDDAVHKLRGLAGRIEESCDCFKMDREDGLHKGRDKDQIFDETLDEIRQKAADVIDYINRIGGS